MGKSIDKGKVNVSGEPVSLKLVERGGNQWYCAYANIKNSQFLSDEYLGSEVTFREGDEFGVDTAHSWNDKESLDEKLVSALYQIERAIVKVKMALKGE